MVEGARFATLVERTGRALTQNQLQELLESDQIRAIVDLMLSRTQKQLTEQRLVMEATDAAKDLLMDKGFDAVFGARPMRRAIQNLIEDPLAEGLLHGRFQPGDTVLVDRGGDDLTLETKQAAPEPEAAEKVPAETSA